MELQADGVQHVKEHPDTPPHPLLSRPEAGGAINEKMIGPDWVHFDVRDRGWNEVIRANATLSELKSPKPERALKPLRPPFIANRTGGSRV